jgi:uncharacterized membrane protein (DUF106 family)
MTTAGLASKVPPKWLILAGLGFFAGGLILLRAMLSANMQVVDFILPMLVMGVGIGLFVAQIVDLTISQVSTDERNKGPARTTPSANWARRSGLPSSAPS